MAAAVRPLYCVCLLLPAAVLVDVLTKYEHAPVLVAGTLRYTIQQWDDGRLVSALTACGEGRPAGKGPLRCLVCGSGCCCDAVVNVR